MGSDQTMAARRRIADQQRTMYLLDPHHTHIHCFSSWRLTICRWISIGHRCCPRTAGVTTTAGQWRQSRNDAYLVLPRSATNRPLRYGFEAATGLVNTWALPTEVLECYCDVLPISYRISQCQKHHVLFR